MKQWTDPSDKGRGLYEKFLVSRTDGQSAVGGFHEACAYFVLDLTHDAHAIPAIRAYADSCERDHPALAADLRKIADAGQRTCPKCGSTRIFAARIIATHANTHLHCRNCGHDAYVTE